jgi:hypothetical protein
MSVLGKVISCLRGGPWIETTGVQISSQVTRFEYPQTITVTGRQRVESVTEYRADGVTINRTRIMPLIPQLWESLKDWVAFQRYKRRGEWK